MAETEIEGGFEYPNTVEEVSNTVLKSGADYVNLCHCGKQPQEQATIPGGNDTSSLENVSSPSEQLQAGVISACPPRNHLPSVSIDHDELEVSNSNVGTCSYGQLL